MEKLYTVYNGDKVVSGLEKVNMRNNILQKMSTRVPLKELDVDDTTFSSGKEKYKVTRVQ